MPKLIRDRLLEALADPDLSVSVLSRMTVTEGDIGIGDKTIQGLLSNPGRLPTSRTLIAIARALGDDPRDYYEWPIAEEQRKAAATPKAGQRRAVDAARKAAKRQSERQSKPPIDPDEKPEKGQAA